MTEAVVGVMAKAPVPGRCKTRLAETMGAARAAHLYEAMLLDTLRAFGRLGAARTVLLAAPEDDGPSLLRRLAPPGWEVIAQSGADLGERLAHAFRCLGERGQPVVLAGSDSPTVPLAPVRAALAGLSAPKRALVGPCDDGGYYLIGLSTPELGILHDVPWSTPDVLAATRRNAAALGLTLEELPSWYDVDLPADVERLAREVAADPLVAPRSAAALAE